MRFFFLLLLLAAGPARPDAPKAELDRLFAALKAAPNEATAAALEEKIRQTRQQAGSPAVRLLLEAGAHDLETGDAAGALETLDDALVLAPDDADAWFHRGLAKFRAGDYPGAIRDLEATLQRDSRHVEALQTLSHIAESREDWKGALAAWQKVLELDPHTPQAQDRLQMLRRKAFGEAT